MWLGILIGLLIAIIIATLASGAREASRLMLYEGSRYKLVAGARHVAACRHDLGQGHKLNGMTFRECRWCDAVFVDVNDLLRVQYDTQA